MCRYYAHQHACKHVSLSFAAFCDPASLIQNPCGQQHIWQTLAVEELCEDCKGLYQDQYHHHHHHQQRQQQYGYGKARGQGQGHGRR